MLHIFLRDSKENKENNRKEMKFTKKEKLRVEAEVFDYNVRLTI